MNQEKFSGFEDNDCKVTAEFVQLHNDLLDVLNSRKLSDPGYKKALNLNNVDQTAELFKKVRHLYDSLEANVYDGRTKKVTRKPILTSERFTGFMGLCTAMNGVELIMSYIKSKKVNLDFLCCYKLLQDHLEIFFNAVR